MMLVELTTVPQAALPVDALKDHMRLGTGFADDNVQDIVLEGFLRAAIAAIEARTGKSLISREFGWTLTGWRDPQRQPLPLAPVQGIVAVVDINAFGDETQIDEGWRLEPDDQRPHLVATGTSLPRIRDGHRVRIEMNAGFGPAWTDLPADLAQAIMMLAAHFYEHRHMSQTVDQAMPFGVLSLIERFRTVRIFAGGRS